MVSEFIGRRYLRVDSDDFVAFFAGIREYRFVAFNAVRVIVAEYVSLSGQRFVALPATEMRRVPILVHGFCEFAAEN